MTPGAGGIGLAAGGRGTADERQETAVRGTGSAATEQIEENHLPEG